MNNSRIAEILNEIGVVLEIKGENSFKVKAYYNAARVIENMNEDVSVILSNGGKVNGVGDHIKEKIQQLCTQGTLPYYEDLKSSIPEGLFELLHIPGLGPKKIKVLFDSLKIHNISKLKYACENNLIADLPGFGEKSQKNILTGILNKEAYNKRHLWYDIHKVVQVILDKLSTVPAVERISPAGSYRRFLETVGDLDFLVASSHPEPVMHFFTNMDIVSEILAQGDKKSSVRLKNGLQVDLRVVTNDVFASALLHSTGSKEHNVLLRNRAKSYGLSLSEYGLKDENTGEYLHNSISTEEDLYKLLHLNYIPPELREGFEEVSYADKNSIPKLLEYHDIKGAFHNHTNASDGMNSLDDMVKAAEDLGWQYIGIADHSKSSFQANGLSEERLLKQIEYIRKLNDSKKYKVHVFSGTECDILSEGVLDFPEHILKQLDYVVVSVHNGFTQDEEQMTKRIIKAIESPHVHMLGHLTGRLLLRRNGYAVNIEKVIDAAIKNNVVIELNANPHRLDMDWRHWKKAAEKGCLCVINPDAHQLAQLNFVQLGVHIARKGWLKKENVINSLGLKEIQKFLSQK